MKRLPLSKLTFLLATLLALVLMTAQASAAPSWNGGTWKIVKSPNGSMHNNLLLGVAAISKDNAWAVGANYTGFEGPPVQALIEHWNGSRWSVVPSPNPRTDNTLFDVAAVSANDVWAMGNTMAGKFGTPPIKILFEHWNGSQWSVVPSPNPGITQTNAGYLTVISKNNIWAVGNYDTSGGGFNVLAMHWNGTSWRVVQTPNPGTVNNLYNIAAVSANDIWAVGNYSVGSGTPSKNFYEHWNGSRWSVVSGPSVGTNNNLLVGLTVVSANDIWSVGTFATSNTTSRTLIEHWNGSRWSIVPSPNVGTNPGLNGVVAISANDIWADGGYSLANGKQLPIMEHWNGSQWSVVQTPTIGSGGHYFQYIAADSANDVWVVGAYIDIANVQQLTLIEHCC